MIHILRCTYWTLKQPKNQSLQTLRPDLLKRGSFMQYLDTLMVVSLCGHRWVANDMEYPVMHYDDINKEDDSGDVCEKCIASTKLFDFLYDIVPGTALDCCGGKEIYQTHETYEIYVELHRSVCNRMKIVKMHRSEELVLQQNLLAYIVVDYIKGNTMYIDDGTFSIRAGSARQYTGQLLKTHLKC